MKSFSDIFKKIDTDGKLTIVTDKEFQTLGPYEGYLTLSLPRGSPLTSKIVWR